MINGRINSKLQSNIQTKRQLAKRQKELMQKTKIMNRFQTDLQLPGLQPPDIRVYEDYAPVAVVRHYDYQIRKRKTSSNVINLMQPNFEPVLNKSNSEKEPSLINYMNKSTYARKSNNQDISAAVTTDGENQNEPGADGAIVIPEIRMVSTRKKVEAGLEGPKD